MKKTQLVISALFLVLLLTACAPEAVPAPAKPAVSEPALPPAPVVQVPTKPAWEVEWERTLAAAKQEGRVVIATGTNPTMRIAMARGIKEAYGLVAEIVGARSNEMAQKVIVERRAGLYNWDIALVGSGTALTLLKPARALAPLETALILPDVTDAELTMKIWWPGKLWWADADHTNLVPMLNLIYPVAINTNLVSEGEVKSFRDLLNPKWQGKVLLNDPSVTGAGPNWLVFANAVLGWDHVVEFAKAKPTVLRDQRLMAEWLTRGKYALWVAPEPVALNEFMLLGAPVKGLIPAEGTWMAGGNTNISMFDHSAHPNAAKIFVNWYLSREGQTLLPPLAGYQSSRQDVASDHVPSGQVRQPGVKYFIMEDEATLSARAALQTKSKELFAEAK